MENQIEIVKDIADGMIGIGGIPSNEEFYAEFDMRVRAALRIHDVVGCSELLPKRLSNEAYKKAQALRYEDFVEWWDNQV